MRLSELPAATTTRPRVRSRWPTRREGYQMRQNMERRLWNDLKAGQSNAKILNELRETQKERASEAAYFLECATRSPWQWGITIDGEWIFGCAIIDELPYLNRGWFVAYAGKSLKNAWQIRPLLRLWNDLQRLGPYDELRAWVIAGASREEAFAKRLGFALDCGPASGYGPSGQDMNLWLWKRSDNEQSIWRRR